MHDQWVMFPTIRVFVAVIERLQGLHVPVMHIIHCSSKAWIRSGNLGDGDWRTNHHHELHPAGDWQTEDPIQQAQAEAPLAPIRLQELLQARTWHDIMHTVVSCMGQL